MRTIEVFGLCVLLLLTAVPSQAFQRGNQPGIEDEFAALVEKVGDLVVVLERQMQARASERSLERVAVVTQLLDIRVRQQANLQKELQALDDREQRFLGYIASNEIKIDNLDKQIVVAIDESRKVELQSRQTELRQYITNLKTQLEYLTQRRSELQGRVADSERRVRDVEDIVQDWLAESRDGDE